MFYTGDQLYCPIIGYELWNVYDGSKWLKSSDGENLWEKKMQFDSDKAILKINDTTELID
jgi:hypothetical protein